eukprot:540708_1
METKEYFQQIQNDFLNDIYETQHTCNNKRVLVFEIMGDGFSNIHHYIGHVLLIAVASNRKLFVYGNFKYYKECNDYSLSNNWYCIYNSVSNCSMKDIENKYIQKQLTNQRKLLKRDIWREWSLSNPFEHTLFNNYFGNENVIEYEWDPFIWTNGIFKQQWFNKFDNLFIRSHIQYFLWMSMNNKTMNIIHSNPIIKHIKSLKRNNEKYIAFHIRKSDNVKMSRKDFNVDGNKIYTMEYYMKIVEENIDINDSILTTIFVCTDNNEIIDNIDNKYRNNSKFKFIYNKNSKKNATSEWIWFLNDIEENDLWNIIIDTELMRLADYLIGSATSNVYRLGMELNYATNWVQNQLQNIDKQTIFSVDVPWHQHP